MIKINIPVIVNKEVRQSRWSHCMDCTHNKNNKICGKCGCPLTPKITLAKSKCPINKW